MYLLAEQRVRLSEHKVQRWNLEARVPKSEQQAVFFGHTVEAPAVIRRAPVEVADFFHPLSAPGRRVEKGHHAKRPRDGQSQSLAHGFAFSQLGFDRIIS